MEKLLVKIKRQASPESQATWEHYQVPYQRGMSVIALLKTIQAKPVDIKQRATLPVCWTSNCQEGVCGSCSMGINGFPRLACRTLIQDSGKPLELTPLSKFPVVKDLVVDRGVTIHAAIASQAWREVDLDRRGNLQTTEPMALSSCIQCGICLEACPQYHDHSPFFGAQAVAMHALFAKPDKISALMEPGGLEDCGNAQNCERVCPMRLPLVETLAKLGKRATLKLFSSYRALPHYPEKMGS